MRFNDIIKSEELINSFIGKGIEITGLSEYQEVNFNKGMRGVITGYTYFDKHTADEHICIDLDFNSFEEYNNSQMEANFYDEKGIPRLKWNEIKTYNGLDGLYLMTKEEHQNEGDDQNTFKLLDKNIEELYIEFNESKYSNYVHFLESKVLNKKSDGLNE